MADRTCGRCGKTFAMPYLLRRHRERKLPCVAAEGHPNACRACGRAFATASSLARHAAGYCPQARPVVGDSALAERARPAESDVATLVGLVERLLRERQPATTIARQTHVHVGNVTVANTNVATMNVADMSVANTNVDGMNVANASVGDMNVGGVMNVGGDMNVTINAWDGPQRLPPAAPELLAATLAESPRLGEFVRWPTNALADPDRARPAVAELMVGLLRRSHAAPEARNVYLNPRRADQALVFMSTGAWEVRALSEVTRLLLDGVAETYLTLDRVAELARTDHRLQEALCLAGAHYAREPDEYAQRARAPLAAHLTNTAP